MTEPLDIGVARKHLEMGRLWRACAQHPTELAAMPVVEVQALIDEVEQLREQLARLRDHMATEDRLQLVRRQARSRAAVRSWQTRRARHDKERSDG